MSQTELEFLRVAATKALQLKRAKTRQRVRKDVVREIHNKQYGEIEEELTDKIAVVIDEQVKGIAQGLRDTTPDENKGYETEASGLMNVAFQPEKWKSSLVDATLPVMAGKMAEAMIAQMMSMGIDPRQKGARIVYEKHCSRIDKEMEVK